MTYALEAPRPDGRASCGPPTRRGKIRRKPFFQRETDREREQTTKLYSGNLHSEQCLLPLIQGETLPRHRPNHSVTHPGINCKMARAVFSTRNKPAIRVSEKTPGPYNTNWLQMLHCSQQGVDTQEINREAAHSAPPSYLQLY